MKRIIISGGGTGGHIYPAITIYKEIAAMTDAEFLYIGTEKGLEATLVPKEGIPFKTLPVEGLNRNLSVRALVTLGKTLGSLVKANRIISEFKPDIVIGTGGYVCGPILLAAALRHVPTLIQEQNTIGGITNKILSRFVDVVAVGFEEAQKAFVKAKRIVYTGNPVRPEVLVDTREEGRSFFNLQNDEFAVLIAGGSRGARSINTAMIEVHKHFKDKKGIKLIHVTGTGEYERVLDALGIKDGQAYSETSVILPYLHEMPKALAAADLAVFRAGAVGLAELTVRGIPSILIPYPYAAEDHQTYNARALVSAGAARMIVDKMLQGNDLIGEIEYFMQNPAERARMSVAAKALGKPQAAHDIAQLALDIAK
ncbi:undecaprenyldiphospho-muramoylpentapeptide beta-N-acetylglucosaminyltransferase [Veillonella criceti]|uniref:UDP-N-acetylglucosamine--N-acetylmuramyl-(pentapeptide) pyrophosphoryl-undecaprenol N-acetylglucosamine transferase n=1 Tax=Veillonella criceti TaxID=103891 RepID=A0A380NHZ9_9FIRM|nr:undecaprenyldiphospho-muramoylpentapeptide beta-N-acetylglucosaminyltransferase [Veillonella criceti]SUP39876.1 UDP-N-acetylglucosamine--N-acetylmuramyl-(pentapeptide) pyrophosphoryl-undecaprenol N-acetylglucosamine transferase [Veillonella criceti]